MECYIAIARCKGDVATGRGVFGNVTMLRGQLLLNKRRSMQCMALKPAPLKPMTLKPMALKSGS